MYVVSGTEEFIRKTCYKCILKGSRDGWKDQIQW